MHPWKTAGAGALIAASLAWSAIPSAATVVSIPLVCTRGPSNQRCELRVDVPQSVVEGSSFTVRIDGKNSGRISHTGLNYIHHMTTVVLVPTGTNYVEGSARIVPDTGSANVRPGATVTKQGNTVSMVLPARVEDGSEYTPPSFEFQVNVTASAGAKVVQRFSQYRVTANAILVGDLSTVCDRTPKPYAIATTKVTAPTPPTQP